MGRGLFCSNGKYASYGRQPWTWKLLREANDGRTAEDFIKDALAVPENYKVEAILSLGQPDGKPEAHTEADLLFDKVHYNKF